MGAAAWCGSLVSRGGEGGGGWGLKKGCLKGARSAFSYKKATHCTAKCYSCYSNHFAQSTKAQGH
jgi:hypothetical protein